MKRKKAIKWIWNEVSNTMAIADIKADLPLISICDDEMKMISPFFSYPYEWLLKYYGWVEIGDLTKVGE